jgi:hypothetical protein
MTDNVPSPNEMNDSNLHHPLIENSSTTTNENASAPTPIVGQTLSEYNQPTPTFKPLLRMPLYLRFFSILLGYGIATILFLVKASPSLNPNTTLFLTTSIVFTLLIAMIAIVDLRLFGEQDRPHLWPLSLAFTIGLFAFTLATFAPTQITQQLQDTSLIKSTIDPVSTTISQFIVNSIDKILSLYGLILVLLVVICILRIRKVKLQANLLFITLASATFLSSISQSFNILYLLGLMTFTTAFYLHLSPLRGIPEMKGILQRLEPLYATHPKLTQDALKVALRLCDGTPLHQKHLCKIVKQSDPNQLITAMLQLGIITTFASRETQLIQLDPSVRYMTKHTTEHPFIHFGMLLIFLLAWTILPMDLIHDATPYYGCLDDMLVAFIILRILVRHK